MGRHGKVKNSPLRNKTAKSAMAVAGFGAVALGVQTAGLAHAAPAATAKQDLQADPQQGHLVDGQGQLFNPEGKLVTLDRESLSAAKSIYDGISGQSEENAESALMPVREGRGEGLVGGNISIGWSIPNAPDSGLASITFPVTINSDTAHKEGIFAAQQYHFQSGDNVGGYIGLQPREGNKLAARFSFFGPGASTSHPNCAPGADGGEGVTCGVTFDAVYGHNYDLTVAQTGPDTWSGTATDTVTGSQTDLGTYTVPAGSGNLKSSDGGFIEYYLGQPTCSQLYRADVVFGAPSGGGQAGTSIAKDEYGGCEGQANYQATPQPDGSTHVTRGFRGNSPDQLGRESGNEEPSPGESPSSAGPQMLPSQGSHAYPEERGDAQSPGSVIIDGDRPLGAAAGEPEQQCPRS